MVRAVLILLVASGCRQLLGFEGLADQPPSDVPPRIDSQIADGPVDDGPTVDAQMCPPGYTQIGPSSYKGVGNQAIPWLSAEDACALDGTHLIVLDSEIERNATKAFLDKNVWIGLSDRVTEGTFIPVTDQQTNFPPATGVPWAAGQPDGAQPNEHCVQMLVTTGELEDIPCGNGRAYICECDGFAENPANL